MKDEQAETDRFEDLCGGRQQAERLARIYANSYPSPEIPGLTNDIFRPASKEENFTRKAKRDGFNHQQIQAFLDLQ